MTDEISVKIGGSSDELTAATAKAEEALKRLSATVKGTTEGLAPMNAATAQFISTYDRAAATLGRAQSAFQHVSEAIEANEISATQASRVLEQIASNADMAAQAQSRFGHGTAGMTREMVVLGHEAISGNFSRIPGSLMVLAQRSGNLQGIIRGLASPFGLAAVAAGAVSVALVEMVGEEERAERATLGIETAFAAVGNSGRETSGQIRLLIDTLSQLHGVTRETAAEIIGSFARTRQIGGELFAELAHTIDQSARAMGVEAPEAARKLAAAFADPATGAKELHATYGILDAAQLRQIETMQRANNLVGAQNVLLEAWRGRLAELPPGLTKTQQTTDELGNAWSRLMHNMGDTSTIHVLADAWDGFLRGLTGVIHAITPLSAVEQAQTRVAYLQKQLDHDQAKNPGGEVYKRHLADLKEKLDQAKTALDQARQAAGQGTVGGSSSAPAANTGTNTAGSSTEDAADAAARRHVGTQTQLNQLLDDEKVIKDQILASDQKLASLSAAGKTGSEEYKAEVAELSVLKDSLKQIGEEREQLLKKPDTGASQMQVWRTELAQQDAALDADRRTQLQADIAFWEQKRSAAKAGSKDLVEIDREIATARIALNKEIATEQKRDQEQQREIAKADAETDIAIAKSRLEAEKQLLEDSVNQGKITAAEKLAALRGLTEGAYQEDLKRLQDELATLNQTPKEYDRVYNEIRRLKAAHEQEMAALDRQSSQLQKQQLAEQTKIWENAFAPAGRAFDSMERGVLQGTQTIRQAVTRAGTDMAISYIGDVAKMALKFGAFEAMQAFGWTEMATMAMSKSELSSLSVITDLLGITTAQESSTVASIAATKAEAAGNIPAQTAMAAMGAASAVASIPYVGPALAMEAAAQMNALGATELGLASAAGGWANVPYDGALTELHKNEMVLPASIASPLRSAIDSGSLSQNNTTSNASNITAGSTTINISYSGSSGGSGQPAQTARMIASAVAAEVRNQNTGLISAIRGAMQ